MIRFSLIVFMMALIAAFLAFTGIVVAAAAEIARLLFYIFVVVFFSTLTVGLSMAARKRG